MINKYNFLPLFLTFSCAMSSSHNTTYAEVARGDINRQITGHRVLEGSKAPRDLRTEGPKTTPLNLTKGVLETTHSDFFLNHAALHGREFIKYIGRHCDNPDFLDEMRRRPAIMGRLESLGYEIIHGDLWEVTTCSETPERTRPNFRCSNPYSIDDLSDEEYSPGFR